LDLQVHLMSVDIDKLSRRRIAPTITNRQRLLDRGRGAQHGRHAECRSSPRHF
jgi:hypothetical protein